jgi:hypothetical protein
MGDAVLAIVCGVPFFKVYEPHIHQINDISFAPPSSNHRCTRIGLVGACPRIPVRLAKISCTPTP